MVYCKMDSTTILSTDCILGDLDEEERSQDLLELEWKDVEPDRYDIIEYFDNGDMDEDHLTYKMGEIFFLILKMNAQLFFQFDFDYVQGDANDVQPESVYYTDFVSIYGRQPGPQSDVIIREIVEMYRRLLMYNALLEDGYTFSVKGRSEVKRVYLVNDNLSIPHERYLEQYKTDKLFGEDVFSFLLRIASDQIAEKKRQSDLEAIDSGVKKL